MSELAQLFGLKKQPEQSRGIERVTAILDACETLLIDKSFEQISINEIIKKAGVSKGTLYHFFEDKQSVFLSMMHRSLVNVSAEISPKPGDNKLDFVDYIFNIERRLEKVWHKHHSMLEFFLSNRFHPDLINYEQQGRAKVAKIIGEQLTSRHPNISPARARNIGLTLDYSIVSLLDTSAFISSKDATALRREWRQMIRAYINDVIEN